LDKVLIKPIQRNDDFVVDDIKFLCALVYSANSRWPSTS